MARRNRNRPKVFNVDDANLCLPLVRAIVADMVHLSRELHDRKQRLEWLTQRRDVSPGDPYSDELAHIEQELNKDVQRLEEYQRELGDLGVIARSASDGLVDFPSQIDGRDVFLCWKYDEPEVLYWHEVDEGYAGRQPLAVGSISADDADSSSDLLSS